MREDYGLGALEKRFADIIWDRAPLPMSALIKICEQEFSWKRTTTYTVLNGEKSNPFSGDCALGFAKNEMP